MSVALEDIATLDDLRVYIHHRLCEKENLLADQFQMTERRLRRRSRVCGLQFTLHGPRNLRLEAIWAADHNSIYLYDAQGNRYEKLRLKHRLKDLPDGESHTSNRVAA